MSQAPSGWRDRWRAAVSCGRHVVASAGPPVLFATVAPLALFYLGLAVSGVVAGIVISTVYAYGLATVQFARQRRVSGLALMTVLMVTLRAGTAAASGQPFMYFAVPVAETGGFALLFLATMLTREPLIVRLARDFLPALADDFAARRQLISWLSWVWALVYLASAATTLALLLTQPVAVYAGAHELTGWAWIGVGIGLSLLLCKWRAAGLFRSALALRHGSAIAAA